MLIYTVQQGLNPRAAGDDLEFVRDGFSWSAFVFTLFWPLYYGLWLVFAIVLALTVLLGAAMDIVGLSDFGRSAVWIAAALLFAFEANNLRRWTMRRRGWRDVGMAAGRTLSEAEHRFFGVYTVSSSGTLIPRADARP